MLVYLLFEHQSTSDPIMALRLLGYMVRIWVRYASAHLGQPLPLVIPAVLAQVPGGWTAATLFAASMGTLASGVLPDFTYFVDDLHHADDDDLEARALSEQARLSLWLLRDARNTATLLRTLARWAPALEALAQNARGEQALFVLLRYVALVSRDLQLADFRAKLRGIAPSTEAIAMTLAERLRSEGHARGKAEAVLVILRARSIAVAPEVERRIRSCADADVLDRWLVRAASASDINELFAD